MTAEELYKVYAAWSGQLHYFVVKYPNLHVDVEYFPNDYYFNIYSGHAQETTFNLGGTTSVPALRRPEGERRATVPVPRPEENPTQADLDTAFRRLCEAAAHVLGVDIGQAALPESSEPESMLKHALPKPRRRRFKK